MQEGRYLPQHNISYYIIGTYNKNLDFRVIFKTMTATAAALKTQTKTFRHRSYPLGLCFFVLFFCLTLRRLDDKTAAEQTPTSRQVHQLESDRPYFKSNKDQIRTTVHVAQSPLLILHAQTQVDAPNKEILLRCVTDRIFTEKQLIICYRRHGR